MRFLIAIPVYNEAAHLQRVLDTVRRYGRDILVVDDGSTDETPTILRAAPDIRVITHPENRGYGQSLIDAFGFADRHGFDWVITLDCDEQHEPGMIPAFVAAARSGVWDVVSGSRYFEDREEDDAPPPDRREINFSITRLLDDALGLRLTDSFCGFKAHRVAAMRRLTLDVPGYAFPLQFWVQCARAGLRITELAVPRIYRNRDRTFGGTLDDPAARLEHYLEVFVRQLRRTPVEVAGERSCRRDCGCGSRA